MLKTDAQKKETHYTTIKLSKKRLYTANFIMSCYPQKCIDLQLNRNEISSILQ